MKSTYIHKNSNGDTRTADHVPSYEEFIIANECHIYEVTNMMISFSDELKNRGIEHDWTKKAYSLQFYFDLCATLNGELLNFTDGDWAKKHYEIERHHLFKNCPEDVNLIDVIEMLCDCVCAGLARSGYVRDLELSPEILNKSVQNTIKLLQSHTILEDESR